MVPRGWGFTPFHRFQSQLLLVILPLSAHELPVLLAVPNRSGLRAIVSGSAYLLLRLSALECLTSLADIMAYYALC